MKPEEKAREVIDQLLTDAGWAVQDYKELNLSASLGVAVREFPLKSGFADYMLLVDRRPVGVVEAKPFGTTLSGVADQSEKYLRLIPDSYGLAEAPPFAYERARCYLLALPYPFYLFDACSFREISAYQN